MGGGSTRGALGSWSSVGCGSCGGKGEGADAPPGELDGEDAEEGNQAPNTSNGTSEGLSSRSNVVSEGLESGDRGKSNLGRFGSSVVKVGCWLVFGACSSAGPPQQSLGTFLPGGDGNTSSAFLDLPKVLMASSRANRASWRIWDMSETDNVSNEDIAEKKPSKSAGDS